MPAQVQLGSVGTIKGLRENAEAVYKVLLEEHQGSMAVRAELFAYRFMAGLKFPHVDIQFFIVPRK